MPVKKKPRGETAEQVLHVEQLPSASSTLLDTADPAVRFEAKAVKAEKRKPLSEAEKLSLAFCALHAIATSSSSELRTIAHTALKVIG